MAKILVVGKFYPPFDGGIEQNTRDVCEYLAHDHDVTALVFNHEPGGHTEIINGVKVIRCRRLATISSQPIGLTIIWELFKARFDIVHFHAPNPFLSLPLLLRLIFWRGRARVAVTHHMDIYGRKTLRSISVPLYTGILKRSSALIVTSLKNAKISSDIKWQPPTHAIPLGIDIDLNHSTPDKKLAAMEWRRSICGRAPVVGFLGRHARYKGLDVLMKALARLDGVHALIAGDGPYRDSTVALAKSLGIEDRVHFLGNIDKKTKLDLLNSIDVFAFPSTEITEAFGVSQIEAMAFALPVVASDLPTGVTDIAIDGETAIVVPPSDVKRLAEGMKLLLEDKELAQRLAQAGRRHVERYFRRELTVERTARVIEHLYTSQSEDLETLALPRQDA